MAALAAAMKQVEERVYGASTSNMTASDLQRAVQASAFPSTGLVVPAHFHGGCTVLPLPRLMYD